jgi:tetratricopeptide (TPR) repeat protein
MRAELADTALARQAGRFVWLDLNFDSPANREFLQRHAIVGTPTLLVLDPAGERATATHLGGVGRAELLGFLDDGARGVGAHATSPADSALARGDAHLGVGELGPAVEGYRDALRLAAPGWPQRARTLAQLTQALAAEGDGPSAATLAAAQAPRMARTPEFAHVVLAGLWSAVRGRDPAWAVTARAALVPLAAEAVGIRGIGRDTRFQLYSALAMEAQARGDSVTVARWGTRWQRDIEAVVPRNDDERTGLDIARVEAADYVPDPASFVPSLEASERAMPGNYVPSFRLAQLLLALGDNDESLAACERGLAKVDGPLGKTWLLELKARGLIARGDRAGAQRVLVEARASALAINTPGNRENNLRMISALLTQAGGAPR